MAVPSDDPSRRLIGYFHDCLEGEFAHQDLADPFHKAQHSVRCVVWPDSLKKLHGNGSDSLFRVGCLLPVENQGIRQLFGRYQLVRQDFQLMVGLVTCRTYDDNVNLISESPLYVGSLNRLASDPAPDDVLVDIRDLIVNPIFIESVPCLERVRLPLSANRLEEVEQTLNNNGRSCTLSDSSAWLWLRKRSRIASSVLHELGELSTSGSDLSDPVAQLLGFRAKPKKKPAASTPELLPTSLTKPQEEAVLNGARYPSA